MWQIMPTLTIVFFMDMQANVAWTMDESDEFLKENKYSN